MARLLTSVGVPCFHESLFGCKGWEVAKARLLGLAPLDPSYASRAKWDNGVWSADEDWLPSKAEAEASYMAAPFLHKHELSGIPVIHVVRDPIRVINSFVNHINYFEAEFATNRFEEFIYCHLPELKVSMSQYDRACLFWVRWNEMVERAIPAYVHRVEDDAGSLLQFLGKTGPHYSNTTVNSFKKPCIEEFTMDKIESAEIAELFLRKGRQYGYRMGLEYLLI
jgi:hypothetical protein